MKEKLIAGIIGAGSIASYHIDAYLKSGIKIQAITDTNITAAESRAKKYKIDKVFADYHKMITKCPEIDLVSICTPNYMHSKITINCLKAGKNVMCEKPPALNAKQTLLMKEAAEKSGKTLMFNFNNRARPDVQALFEHVKSGEIGTINSAQALWIRRCGIPGFGGWFTQKKFSGGGPVIDLLHMMDLGLYFMGYPEPAWVLAQTFNDFCQDKDFKGPWGIPDVEGGIVDVETACHALVTFKAGQVLFARNSWAEQNDREEVSLTFQGKKAGGTIKRLFGVDGIDDTAIDTCAIYKIENGVPVNKELHAPKDPKMGRERTVQNFINSVMGKEQPLNKPDEAVVLMRVIDAIYQSAEIGKPIRMT